MERTKLEKRMFVMLIRLALALDNANPEVGMGPTVSQIANEINRSLSDSIFRPFNREEVEAAVIEASKQERKWQ